jgi:glycosyltransferase involved in cell wall biosynthesis
MKIAILASSFPRYSGDYQGNFIYHHAYGQVLLGNEVHVICPHVPESPFYDVIDGIKVHRFPYFYPFRLQCLTSETGMYSALRQSPLAVFQLPLFCICMLYLTNRIIIRYDIDIIHSHWLIPQGLVGMIARKLRNIPHVLSSHGIDAQIFSRWPVLIPVLKLILSGTDVLTTNSTYTKKVITKLSPVSRPVRVIPMGVLPSQQVSQKKIISDEITILFVGRLIPWKGVDTLIKAMVHVLENILWQSFPLLEMVPSESGSKALHRIWEYQGGFSSSGVWMNLDYRNCIPMHRSSSSLPDPIRGW